MIFSFSFKEDDEMTGPREYINIHMTAACAHHRLIPRQGSRRRYDAGFSAALEDIMRR